MAKILTFEIPENEYNDLKSFLKDCSAEVRKSLETMKHDQAEIDFLRKESQTIKEETRQIKEETKKLELETGELLADLQKQVLKAA